MLYTLCLWVARAGEQKRPGPEAHTRPTDVGCGTIGWAQACRLKGLRVWGSGLFRLNI